MGSIDSRRCVVRKSQYTKCCSGFNGPFSPHIKYLQAFIETRHSFPGF